MNTIKSALLISAFSIPIASHAECVQEQITAAIEGTVRGHANLKGKSLWTLPRGAKVTWCGHHELDDRHIEWHWVLFSIPGEPWEHKGFISSRILEPVAAVQSTSPPPAPAPPAVAKQELWQEEGFTSEQACRTYIKRHPAADGWEICNQDDLDRFNRVTKHQSTLPVPSPTLQTDGPIMPPTAAEPAPLAPGPAIDLTKPQPEASAAPKQPVPHPTDQCQQRRLYERAECIQHYIYCLRDVAHPAATAWLLVTDAWRGKDIAISALMVTLTKDQAISLIDAALKFKHEGGTHKDFVLRFYRNCMEQAGLIPEQEPALP